MDVAPPDMIIVGRPYWNDGMVANQAKRDPDLAWRVMVLNDLSDAGLQALYDRALFTLYSSPYKG